MTGLLDVFSAWFRSFGYTTQTDAQVTGASGRTHTIPLLVERDARRVPTFAWIRHEPLDATLLEPILGAVRDCGFEQGLLICLGPVGDAPKNQFHAHGVQVWDAWRIVQELGEAVLAETVPELWARTDPLQPNRPSLVMERASPTVKPPVAAAPTSHHPTVQVPLLPAMDPAMELPFPAAVPPALAPAASQPTPELQVPAAFGMFDTFTAASVTPVAVPAPATAPTTGKQILRCQVSRSLAVSLCQKKLRTADRVFLRLSPYFVYDYEANLLVEGSLDGQAKRGRVGVDAVQKRVVEWNATLETAPLAIDGADVDEKRIRLEPAEAERLAKKELLETVTRDVVMEEDGDEWSVIVKKKVTLGPDDVRLTPLGTFWVPVWRVTGKGGSMEIDAATGAILFEEIVPDRADAQLI